VYTKVFLSNFDAVVRRENHKAVSEGHIYAGVIWRLAPVIEAASRSPGKKETPAEARATS
jgi:hypothetical protein